MAAHGRTENDDELERCCLDDGRHLAAGNRLFFPYGDDGSVYGQEFGYLEEPTAALPGTTRDGDLTPWAICFAVLAAATGYAGVRLMADSLR